MSRRYWNIREKRTPLRWDSSWEHTVAAELEDYENNLPSDFSADEDYQYNSDHSSGIKHKQITEEQGECPVYFEVGPVVRLDRRCRWHEPACRQCLRQYLVVRAQKDAKNYPLKCFHPQCGSLIRGEQLEVHELFENKAERARHYHLAELARRQKGGDKLRLVHCPSCDHPRIFKPEMAAKQQDINFTCRACHESFDFSPRFYVLQAMDRFKEDEFGPNNGYGYCPKCGMLISKGDGGEYMVCFCGHEFLWSEARDQMNQKNFGRVPWEEVPLWW